MSRRPLLPRPPRGALHLTTRWLYIAGVAIFAVGTVVWVLADAGLDAGPALYTLSVVILSIAWLTLVVAACLLAALSAAVARYQTSSGSPSSGTSRSQRSMQSSQR